MDNNSFEPDVDGRSKSPGLPDPKVDSTSIEMPRGEKSIPDKPYAGMGKEDLLRFSQTPFWNRLRLACLIIFWGAWVGLLTAVVALTVVAPRCEAPPQQNWWQRTVIYQVYVRSFYDSDGNGIGDLKGITSKLDYIKDLNVETVSLSAFYPSHYGEPDRVSNMGYDVTDHKDVDPDYGTLADFEELLAEAHKRDLKVVIDFIPNHTGDKHPWFAESAADGDPSNPKWNYYVWADCGTTPNWLSVYGESSWVQPPATAGRPECYLNQFLTDQATPDPLEGYQPDLNLRSAAVRAELEDILRFWLDMGVDGFRLVDSKFLFEDLDLADEVELCTDTSDYNCRDHSRTTNQAETFEIITSWRGILETYSAEQERILITDARDTVNTTMRYYGLRGDTGAHLPLNYQLLQIDPGTTTGNQARELVEEVMKALPGEATPDWLTGTQDLERIGSGVSEAYARSLALLKMTLPGPPLVYYGEELNMVNGEMTFAASTDPTGLNRDNFRTPMQWDATANGGFQNATGLNDTWVPVNPDYLTKNVEALARQENSTLALYRSLAALRRTENGLAFGLLEYAAVDDNVFSYVRQFDGTNRFLVAINFGAAEGTFDLRKGDASVPGNAELLAHSSPTGVNERAVGDEINLGEVTLGPGEGALFRWAFSR